MMKLDRILPFARILLEKAVKEGDAAVDATLGNGHDTVFLANLVGQAGRVYGFDIQEEAITASKERINTHGFSDRVRFFQQGHEQLLTYIPAEEHGKVTGAIFNLGYLPGGDKSVITKPNTTIDAIDQLLKIMSPEGIIVIVIYHGHPGGDMERNQLLQYCEKIDQNVAHVLKYQFINQKNNPPFIVAIEKK
jgi:tRNA A58 N-methylase Trm61